MQSGVHKCFSRQHKTQFWPEMRAVVAFTPKLLSGRVVELVRPGKADCSELVCFRCEGRENVSQFE